MGGSNVFFVSTYQGNSNISAWQGVITRKHVADLKKRNSFN